MASVRVCWLLALLLVTASSGDDVSASNKPSPTAWALAAGQPKDGPDVTPDNATVHAMASVRPEFVHVRNGEFFQGCKSTKVVGWNAYKLLEAAADVGPQQGRRQVMQLLREASRLGLNTLRTWAFSVLGGDNKLQKAPGVYNERVFEGLDYLLAAAALCNIRVVLVFTNHWKFNGGVDEYVQWSPTASTTNDFWADAAARRLYRNHVIRIVNRRNRFTGVQYKDDPTILGWELCNEPRCEMCDTTLLSEWIRDSARFLKAVDRNHLVSVGIEGFYGADSQGSSWINPGTFGVFSGQDFVEHHQSADIDYATFHLWPGNWNRDNLSFMRQWIRAHVTDTAQYLPGKPLLLSEFGRAEVPVYANQILGWVSRPRYYSAVYDLLEELMVEPDTPLQGSLFWAWQLPWPSRSAETLQELACYGPTSLDMCNRDAYSIIGPESAHTPELTRAARHVATLRRAFPQSAQECTSAATPGFLG